MGRSCSDAMDSSRAPSRRDVPRVKTCSAHGTTRHKKWAPKEPAPSSRRKGREAGKEQSCQSGIPLYFTSNRSMARMSLGVSLPAA